MTTATRRAITRAILPVLAAQGCPQAHSLLARALDQLPLDAKVLLALGAEHALSVAELAAVFQVPPAHLRQRLTEATEVLRLVLLRLIQGEGTPRGRPTSEEPA